MSKARVRYTIRCPKCGKRSVVHKRHFGRMCYCQDCQYPIYVTYDKVTPPFKAYPNDIRRYFSEDAIPVNWRKGDLFMELYEVSEVLGSGGNGVVYRIYHRGWGVELAVKCPKVNTLKMQGWAEIFEHECQTWIGLTPHPNAVTCFYVRRMGGIPRVFIEYVDGRDLGNMIVIRRLYEGGHAAALQRILDIAIQMCWGLQHAHDEGVVHQDVKPRNVLVSRDGIVKMTDLGLARVWITAENLPDTSNKRSSLGPEGGTPVYISPDSSDPEHVTHKSDMWSWGVSVMEMFAGGVFWSDGTQAREALEALKTTGPKHDMVPPMPHGIRELLERCFAPAPDDRPDRMLDLVEELREIYEAELGRPYDRPIPEMGALSLDIYNNRAVSLSDLGRMNEAVSLWTKVLEAAPDHPEAAFNLDLHRWRTGRLNDAQVVERLYQDCASRPGDWVPAFMFARVLIERGDCAMAVQVLEHIPPPGGRQREVAFSLAIAQDRMPRDKRMLHQFRVHSAPVSVVRLSRDNAWALTGDQDGDIRMWDVSMGRCLVTLQGHAGRINAAVLSENEKTLVSGGEDGTLRVWASKGGVCVHVLRGHKGPVRCVDITRDGKRAVSGGADGAIIEWNLRSGEVNRVIDAHKGAVNAVCYSEDGGFVVSGGEDCQVRQWDMQTGGCKRSFMRSDSRITSVAVHEERGIVLAGSGGRLLVWLLETGKLVRAYAAHSTEIASVSLGLGGRYALSATLSGTMRIWDIVTGQCIRSLKGQAPVYLSRDGCHAVSTADEGSIRVWAVNCDTAPFAAPFILSRSIAQLASRE